MTKAIVLAANWHSYVGFMQQYSFYRTELRYALDQMDVCGFHWDVPVILLQGYELNPRYTLQFMDYIGHRFNNIGFISEGERYND